MERKQNKRDILDIGKWKERILYYDDSLLWKVGTYFGKTLQRVGILLHEKMDKFFLIISLSTMQNLLT